MQGNVFKFRIIYRFLKLKRWMDYVMKTFSVTTVILQKITDYIKLKTTTPVDNIKSRKM